MTDTAGAENDTVITTAKTLSPGSKLPLTSTKSAPESLIMGPAPTLPDDKPDLVSSVSAGGNVSSSSMMSSKGGQKPLSELPSTRPTKCK